MKETTKEHAFLSNKTKKAFDELYEDILPKLKSYLYRLVAHSEDMEDLAQETYIRALKNKDAFEGRSSFKTWVFTIATNLANDHHRANKRWPINAQDNCSLSIKASDELQAHTMAIYHNRELGKYEIKEHIDYCFTCVMKYLPLERQLAIMLADIYEFNVAEISQILNKSIGAVKHLLHNGRNTMKQVFDHDCSLISKTGVCYKCSELNHSGNSKAQTQQEIASLELAQSVADSSKTELYQLRTKLVKSIDPLQANSFHLHNFLLHQTDYACDKVYPDTGKKCAE